MPLALVSTTALAQDHSTHMFRTNAQCSPHFEKKGVGVNLLLPGCTCRHSLARSVLLAPPCPCPPLCSGRWPRGERAPGPEAGEGCLLNHRRAALLPLGEGVASVILAASPGARRANIKGKWPGRGGPLSGSQSRIQDPRGATFQIGGIRHPEHTGARSHFRIFELPA